MATCKRIYVIIKGRSGNQLFQYSFARAIQEKVGGELILDFSEMGFNKSTGKYGPHVHMDNVLDYFNVKPYTYVDAGIHYQRNITQRFQLFTYRLFRKIYRILPNSVEGIASLTSGILQRMGIYYQYSTNSFLGYRQPSLSRNNFFIRGWFESAAFFDMIHDILRKEFVFSLPLPDNLHLIYSNLLTEESICVTVRRGDFTSNEFKDEFLICSPEYYKAGVSLILQKYPDSFVFICSDDIEWCKENLVFPSVKVIYEPASLSISDKLQLMTVCRHFVISNSTFSFWAQYLSVSPNKMVIAPSVWRRCNPPVKDIFMENWTLLDC